MEITTAGLVFWAVVLSRLLVPLAIPRFPLPAILACLIIDAADQSIFQAIAPDADLTAYQSYDKALDIYYLVIAYIAVLRNWTNQHAIYIARFLIFYRLVGVVFFELGVPLPLGLEEILGEQGRLVLRYSGTEPLARVMIEGPEMKQIDDLAHRLIDAIQVAVGEGPRQ